MPSESRHDSERVSLLSVVIEIMTAFLRQFLYYPDPDARIKTMYTRLFPIH